MLRTIFDSPFHSSPFFGRWESPLFDLPRSRSVRGSGPSINVYANEAEAIIQVIVPGIDAEALDISVEEDGTVEMSLPEPEQKGEAAEVKRVLLEERKTYGFSRRIKLPFPLNVDGVRADYKAGVLTVTLERADQKRTKKIEIKTGS